MSTGSVFIPANHISQPYSITEATEKSNNLAVEVSLMVYSHFQPGMRCLNKYSCHVIRKHTSVFFYYFNFMTIEINCLVLSFIEILPNIITLVFNIFSTSCHFTG